MFEMTDNTYKVELAIGKPVLLNFWAPWCRPCGTIAPVIAAITREYRSRINVFTVDSDDNPLLTVKYDIRCLPTMILVKSGRSVDRITGWATKPEIETMLNRHAVTHHFHEAYHAV
jgi:thioredoxin 1